MAEDYGLSLAPVLVVDLRAVFGRDRRHGMLSLVLGGGCRRRRLGIRGGSHRGRERCRGDHSGTADEETAARWVGMGA